MAARKNTNDKPGSPLGDVSKDKPRTLERVRDGAKVRVTDPLEYASLTTAHGYRDVTAAGTRKSSSNVGTGSGGAPAADNTTTAK